MSRLRYNVLLFRYDVRKKKDLPLPLHVFPKRQQADFSIGSREPVTSIIFYTSDSKQGKRRVIGESRKGNFPLARKRPENRKVRLWEDVTEGLEESLWRSVATCRDRTNGRLASTLLISSKCPAVLVVFWGEGSSTSVLLVH